MTKKRLLLIVLGALVLVFVIPAVWIVIEVNRVMAMEPVVDDSIERTYQEAGIEALGADASSSYGAWDEMCRILEASTALEQGATATVTRGEATLYFRIDELEPAVRAVYDELIAARIAAEAEREPGDPFGPQTLLDFARVRSAKAERPDISVERDLIERMITLGLFDRIDAVVHAYPFKEPSLDGLSIGRDMSELASARGMAKAMAADMCLRAEEGDFDTVAARTETLIRLGQTMSWNPTLIRWLVGAAIHSLTLTEIRTQLDEYEFTEDAARKMLRAVQRWPVASIDRALDGEKAAIDFFMQEYFTDDGNGDGYMSPGAVEMGGASPASDFVATLRARYLMPDRRTHQDAFDAMFDDLRPLANTRPIDREINIRDRPELDDSAPAIVSLLVPALGRCATQADQSAFAAAYTCVMLALEVYRAVQGVWPDSLDTLAPDILDAPPVDPVTGMAFGYRVEGDDYVLYGFGIDGVDDGGSFMDDRRATTPLLDDRWPGHDVELREVRDVWEE